jgi:hypothetical protein
MGTLWIVAGLCLLLVAGGLVMVWMTVIRLRDQKKNGDLIIRQRRGKGILGLALGLLLAIGGPAMLVANLGRDLKLNPEELCIGPGLLVLGVLVTWVSLRGLRDPHVIISAARREIEIRHSGIQGKQTWSFDALAGVICEPRIGEDALLSLASIAIAPQYSSGSPTDRAVIGLQHADGQIVRIGTATQGAAQRVPELIAAATGKPVLSWQQAQTE